ELVEMLEHETPVIIDGAEICMDVGKDRILVQVVANHLRDERINGLVVRDSVAEPVRDRDVARSKRADEPRDTHQRLLPSEYRVEPFVIEAALDDGNGIEAPR